VTSIIDSYNREVEYKEDSSRYVCLGTGSLRLYTYIGDVSKIVGIENVESTWGSIGRPYNLVLDNIGDLPIVGNGGPLATLDAEKILMANPDVIFISDFFDIDAVNALQDTVQIPVIVLSYNDVAGDIFNDVLYNSMSIIGTVTGNENRSSEVIKYLKDTKVDLINRAIHTKVTDNIYIGGQAYKGKHGIESTSGDYKIFDILNISNVVKEAGILSHIIVDKEQVLEWNPDIIIMDANGYKLFEEDYKDNKEYYDQLQAFQNNQVYLQMPFNYYSTNIEIALSNAYYIGKVIHPENFTDIDPIEKYNEISRFFLGVNTYDEMKQDYYGGYQVIQKNS
jgi:iron complex transport system substrate-binding protein